MKLSILIILTFSGLTAQGAQLQIVNENSQPVVGAEVMIGMSAAEGMTIKTDVNGSVAIPTNWKTSQPVTITATGYLTATFMNVMPNDSFLQIRREDAKNVMQVQGEPVNFENIKKDGKVDFALVFPGLREQQLTQFDVESVISTDVDVIRVLTEQLKVPSNFTLPEQKENYVLPITLDKPLYRLAFKQPGEYRMMAIRGQFPLNQVVGEIRDGKAFYEVLNYFRFMGGGQRDITVNNSLVNQDIPVNQIQFNKKVTVKAPAALGTEHVMLSFSLVNQAGLYFPSDVKRIFPNSTVDLVMPPHSDESSIVSILMPISEAEKIGGTHSTLLTPSPFAPLVSLFADINRFFNFMNVNPVEMNAGKGGLSLVRQAQANSEPVFLDLIPRPAISQNKLILKSPKPIAAVDAVATVVLLSEVERIKKGDVVIEQKFRVWEVSQLGWANEIHLPDIKVKLSADKKYRWEVLFMGRHTDHNETGGHFLNGITHVSRNSLDIM